MENLIDRVCGVAKAKGLLILSSRIVRSVRRQAVPPYNVPLYYFKICRFTLYVFFIFETIELNTMKMKQVTHLLISILLSS